MAAAVEKEVEVAPNAASITTAEIAAHLDRWAEENKEHSHFPFFNDVVKALKNLSIKQLQQQLKKSEEEFVTFVLHTSADPKNMESRMLASSLYGELRDWLLPKAELVVVSTPAADEEREKQLMDAIGQPFSPAPRIEELQAALFTPLLSPIGVSSKNLAAVPAALKSSFAPYRDPWRSLDNFVAAQCDLASMADTPEMRSEDTWGHYHGQFIAVLLEKLSRHHKSRFSFARNQIARSTFSLVVDSKRPDFMVHTSAGALLLLGEEKDLSKGHAQGLEMAMTELVQKLQVWNVLFMGELPYILCYATAGDHVRFFALGPSMVLQSLHEDPIVVSEVSGALQLTLAAINIFRILHTLRRSGPQLGAPVLFSTIRRPDVDIAFQANSVCKVYHTSHKRPRADLFPFAMLRRGPFTERDAERLNTFFTRLYELGLRPDCLEVPIHPPTVSVASSSIQVDLVPVGIERVPKTKAEFACCLRSILRALDILHTRLGYVHGDVRWPNVITVPLPSPAAGESRWCLIDFGEVVPIASEDRATPAADLEQLAAMLTPGPGSAGVLLFGQMDFDVRLDHLRALLREEGATAAGMLGKVDELGLLK